MTHVETTRDGREVHFHTFGKIIGYAEKRFCPYCGSKNINIIHHNWPECTCKDCGLPFHDSSTQADYSDFKKAQKE